LRSFYLNKREKLDENHCLKHHSTHEGVETYLGTQETVQTHHGTRESVQTYPCTRQGVQTHHGTRERVQIHHGMPSENQTRISTNSRITKKHKFSIN